MLKQLIAMGMTVCVCTAAMAQDAPAPPTPAGYVNTGGLYIKGGLNLANVSTSSDGSINSANTRASFNVGLRGDLPLANFLSLQIGAEFTGKGSRAQYNSSLYTGTYTFRPYYVEIPVNAVFKVPLGPGAAILVGGGVYGAMGVAGDYVTNVTSAVGSSTSTSSIKWTDSGDITTGGENGSGAGVLRRYDFGMNYLAGVELGPVQITANYGMGLTKIYSTADNNNDNNKNRVWSVNFGFRL
jgi:hypothetical protein